MSHGYQQYGGNPYGREDGYDQQNPYGGQAEYQANGRPYVEEGYGAQATAYGTQTPYGIQSRAQGAPHIQHQASTFSQGSTYSGAPGYVPGPQGQPITPMPQGALPAQPRQPMSQSEFLQSVESVRAEIRNLTGNVAEIGTLHQRILASPDNTSSPQLEHLVSQTQIQNTRIKDQIKRLETDAARSGGNVTKDSQIRNLKASFTKQLEDYRQEEQTYQKRYREQIGRQYRIVNPDATEEEVRLAQDADWGNEGVFQTALKSNRTGAANSVLGAVRARHNDIQQIEKTLVELNQLFLDLAEAVHVQDPMIQQTEQRTEEVKNDTEQANVHVDKAIKSARSRRKLKWWCLFIVVAIIVILGLVLGLYFGLTNRATGGGQPAPAQ